MAKFTLSYPAKPYKLNQAWGVYNAAYLQFGFSLHNGIDIALGADKTLHAPFPYTIVRIGNQPEGGGIFFGLMSEPFDFPDGTYRVLLDMLHCDHLLAVEGQTGMEGDLLAIADNTGFTTGPHTHLQPRRIAFWNGKSGNDLVFVLKDKNGANDSFDLVPYFNGTYAVEAKILPVAATVVAGVADIAKEVENLPADQQPYWKAALMNVLAALAGLFK